MKASEIKQVAIIGSGAMGQGIAINFAQFGVPVRLVDQNREILDNALRQISQSLNVLSEFGLLAEDSSHVIARMEKFTSAQLEQATNDCQFIIECIPEVLQLKRELFAHLDSYPPETILSTNTSSFNISTVTDRMRTGARVIGTHFFMPAHIVPLVEIHLGQNTRQDVIEATCEIMLRVGKKPVLVRKEIPGFIVNRIQAAIAREANYLLEQGVVTPEDFDTAARASYGFRLANLGPLAQADVNGLDTVVRGNQLIYKSLCNADQPAKSLVAKVNRGELGLKSGKGYYDYAGKSRDQIIKGIERNLLKQLILFSERERPLPNQ